MKFNPDYQKPPLRTRSIDGVNAQPKTVARATSAVSATATIAQPVIRRSTAQTTRPSKHGIWQRLQLPVILFAGTLAGFLIQTTALGMIAIALYGIYALALRVPSRTTFSLAALSFGAVACLLLVKPDPELAGNFSTYTFLLLVIGVIALLREGRPLKRRKRSRPRNRR